MSLTNERLKEIINKDNDYIPIFRQMAEELLQLRSLRDSGDEAVTELYNLSIQCGFYPKNPKERQLAVDYIVNLRDIAIARGRTRTDAVNKAAEWAKECEALQEEIERLKLKLEHKSQQVDSQVSLVSEMQAKIDYLTEQNGYLHDEAQVTDSLVLTLQEEVKMLTKERDEAKWVKNAFLEFSTREILELRDGVGKDIERLTSERDESRKELAELRKAPGMEEVDAVLNDVNSSMFGNQDRLAAIARRAIESREVEQKRADAWQENCEDENSERLMVEKERDEVVGLLKWLKQKSEDGLSITFMLGSNNPVSVSIAHRILEIVEGE